MWYILNQERMKLQIIKKIISREIVKLEKILLFSPLWERDVLFTYFILMIKIFIGIWGVYFVIVYKNLVVLYAFVHAFVCITVVCSKMSGMLREREREKRHAHRSIYKIPVLGNGIQYLTDFHWWCSTLRSDLGFLYIYSYY